MIVLRSSAPVSGQFENLARGRAGSSKPDDAASLLRAQAGPMAEVVETNDLTEPAQHGWAVGYRIRREDGEELHAEVRCWDKAHAAAERSANADALAAIADRGLAAVLEYAELVESPATRGAVLISIWFDPIDAGNLRRRVGYERAPAA